MFYYVYKCKVPESKFQLISPFISVIIIILLIVMELLIHELGLADILANTPMESNHFYNIAKI